MKYKLNARRPARTAALALALLVPLSPGASAHPQEGGRLRQELTAEIASWPGLTASELAGRVERVGRRGELAAELAMRAYSPEVDLLLRRAYGRLALDVGDAACLPYVLAALAEPDPEPDGELRKLLTDFLAKPELREARLDERLAALDRIATGDALSEVRGVALNAVGRITDPRASAILDRWIDELPAPARVYAARRLAGQAQARDLVVERVQACFDPGREPNPRAVPEDVLEALLLFAYGDALAEQPRGGEGPSDLAPFVHGARHSSEDVRRSALVALERYVQRLRFLGDLERADRVLTKLVGRGLDDRGLLERRATLALESGSEFESALEAARKLARMAPLADDLELRLRHTDALLLEVASLLALGRPEEASEPLAKIDAHCAGLAAERLELRGSTLAGAQVSVLTSRALGSLYEIVQLMLTGRDGADPGLVTRARKAHELLLEVQLAATRGSSDLSSASGDFNTILDHPLGPIALVLSNPRSPRIGRRRALEIEEALYRALASVAPHELPGFQPLADLPERLANPLRDPERLALLKEVQRLQFELVLKFLEREGARPGLEMADRMRIRVRVEEIKNRQTRELGDETKLRQVRTPSDAALRFSENLRVEGRTSAARELAQRLLSDLERLRDVLSAHGYELLRARGEMSLSGILMDQDLAGEAERLLDRSVSRLVVLEESLGQQGVSPATLAMVQNFRVNALISLAVNANVRLKQPERAVEFFEQAYALRQDDFMRVLLACYRARAGREAEAREVLRSVPVSPYNYYNLACTYALLGEEDIALDFLQRDFEELRASEGSENRQKRWARDDPDLELLRGHPRFEKLIEQAEGARDGEGR